MLSVVPDPLTISVLECTIRYRTSSRLGNLLVPRRSGRPPKFALLCVLMFMSQTCLQFVRNITIGRKIPLGQYFGFDLGILMGLVHQDSGDLRVLGHRMPAEQIAAKWDRRTCSTSR